MLWLHKQSWRSSPNLILACDLGFCACQLFRSNPRITIADLSLISKLQPIFVAILAPIVIGVGKAGPLALALMSVAMFGCVLLLAPSLQVGNSFGLLAVSAALFSGGAHTCLRLLKMVSHGGGTLVSSHHAAYGALHLDDNWTPSTPTSTVGCLWGWGLCHHWAMVDDKCL